MNLQKVWTLIKEIDLYGKEPDIYYKGKQRKTSWMGRIFTLIYIIIYIYFLVYRLSRMFKRQDVSFSETNSSIGELPNIHVNKEKFLYAFSLLDDKQKPYIDRSIYEPLAFAEITTTTEDGIKETNRKMIDVDICTKDDFGKNYQKYLSSYNLSNFYCFKNFDITFEGYSGAVNNTNIILTINRCNSRSPVECKTREEIKEKLDGQKMFILSEDFDITPYDFEHPVKEKLSMNTCGINLAQLQTFVAFYQLTNIETDYNLLGFESLADIRKQKYLIYHSSIIMQTQMEPDSIPAVVYYISMKEKVLTNQRKYVQFVDVLGDVGGLMEVMNAVFGVICYLVADILYDKTMVNNLFSFDLEENVIKIKNKNAKKIIVHNHNNINNNEKNPNLNNFNSIINLNKKTIDFPYSIKKENEKNDLDTIYLKKEKSNSKLITKKLMNASENNYSNFNSISNSERFYYLNKDIVKKQKSILNPIYNINKEINEKDISIYQNKDYNKEKQNTDKSLPKKQIIKKINTNIFCTYFFFCFSRKRKNIANTLLDEAMSIITDKLDIYNIFRNMYYIDDIKQLNNYEYKDIDFSDECKQKLKEICDKIYNSFYNF